MLKLTTLAAALTTMVAVSGCASYSTPQMAEKVNTSAKKFTDTLMTNNTRVIQTTITDEPYIQGSTVDYVSPNQGNVSITVASQPFMAVFQGIADQAKFSAVMASTIADKSGKIITVDLRNVTHEQAMRDIAAAAGYVVVFDHSRKIATITDRATYTFRLPSRVFNDQVASKYTMSNNPSSGGGGGGGSSGGAGGAGATQTTSNVSVTGGTMKSDSKTLKDFIQQMVGSDADVSMLPNEGIIQVRAQSQQLRRVQAFLTDYAKFAMTQVQMEVAMVQVTLSDDMSTGIDWSKVIKAAGPNVSFSLNTAGVVASPTASLAYTSGSVNSVVNVLEKTNDARVLSRHKFMAFNNTATMMFDGKQVPYIGKVQQSVTGTSGTATTTGEFTFAMDGISTAVYTNVIDNAQAELTLLPVLSSIEGFETATISGNVIKAPIQPLSQGHFPFLAKHGQTLIFAGANFGKDALNKSGLPGVTGTGLNKILGGNEEGKIHRELVFLVNTSIHPVQKFNPLVGESL